MLLVSFLNISAVRYRISGQLIYLFLSFFCFRFSFSARLPFSVLLVCLYLFFLCHPSYPPFFSKNSDRCRNYRGLNARATTKFFTQCMILLFLIAGLAACQSSESPTISSPDTQATQPSGGGETPDEGIGIDFKKSIMVLEESREQMIDYSSLKFEEDEEYYEELEVKEEDTEVMF